MIAIWISVTVFFPKQKDTYVWLLPLSEVVLQFSVQFRLPFIRLGLGRLGLKDYVQLSIFQLPEIRKWNVGRAYPLFVTVDCSFTHVELTTDRIHIFSCI